MSAKVKMWKLIDWSYNILMDEKVWDLKKNDTMKDFNGIS